MKNIRYVVLTSGLILFGIGTHAQEAKITVHVTDENGVAISNAEVAVGFMGALKPGEGWGSCGENSAKGTTDTNGFFSTSGVTTAGSLGLSACKDGYYENGGQSITPKEFNTTSHRWEPWNPTVEVVLKKKGIQIPMYAARVHQIKIPALGKPLGFDLMSCDWVAPYGKGQISDLVFKWEKKLGPKVSPRENPPFDVTFSLSFSNDGDGIQSIFVPQRTDSILRLPRSAPTDGYSPSLTKHQYRERGQTAHVDFRNDQNYFFRVRTKKDANGKIISALYGKIYGDFNHEDGGLLLRDTLSFIYYLNPEPNSLNMEFDPHRNLLNHLASFEKVIYP